MRSTIPVDLLNPGQVFACLGLAEATQALLYDQGPCEGPLLAGFDTHRPEGAVFHIDVPGDLDAVATVLDFLGQAEVIALAPSDTALSAEKWSITTEEAPDEAYPMATPDSPATLVACLRSGGSEIRLDHWGDSTQRDNVKFWAGAGGYPGVALLRDALELARPRLADAAADPFAVAAPQSSSFRFDWRHDYVPIDTGFSLNAHGHIQPRGYPWVEVLAAVGLTHARPLRPSRDKLLYRYGVLEGLHTLTLHRPALGCAPLPFPMRAFRIHLGWPGKAGQARCITQVVEETPE